MKNNFSAGAIFGFPIEFQSNPLNFRPQNRPLPNDPEGVIWKWSELGGLPVGSIREPPSRDL
jgi:hypothetical protein